LKINFNFILRISGSFFGGLVAGGGKSGQYWKRERSGQGNAEARTLNVELKDKLPSAHRSPFSVFSYPVANASRTDLRRRAGV
jgi:hypothetical protein